MLFCAFVGTAWAQSSLRISEGLLNNHANGQYSWTSEKLTAPEGEFNTLRITFLKNSNNSKPAGFPYVAIAEFYLYDKDGNVVSLTSDKFSSNATETAEGSMDKICNGSSVKQDGEGDYEWYWHSSWSNASPNPYSYHYLEIDLTGVEADLSNYSIGWVTRQTAGSPSDIIISTGATSNEAMVNANNQFAAPQVSTDIVHVYTIKSVRAKNYLTYSEDNAKPIRNANVTENGYWYFTQGTDGKVLIHNAASGKVLGSNFEWSTEGEWYVSPAQYRPGVVFSLTNDISANNCIDDQNGSIGSWQHVENDNEGTTWLLEEVDASNVHVPMLSLATMKIATIGSAVTEVIPEQWYILNNVGRNGYVSNEANNWKMRATSNVAAGNLAKDKAGYLFKITKNGENYNIISGNGNYFKLGSNSATTSATPVNFEIALIGSSTDNFYIFDKDNGYAADGQDLGYNFVGWSTSAPTNAGGNDSYRLLPVELVDAGELVILKTELDEAIANAQALYNGVAEQVGNAVGQYIFPNKTDIETQLNTIVAFRDAIDENTTADDISAKIVEVNDIVVVLEALEINMPTPGKYYVLRCNHENRYVYVNANNKLNWIANADANPAEGKYVWQFEAAEDGKFKMKSVETQSYLTTVSGGAHIVLGEEGADVTISAGATAGTVKFEAGNAGVGIHANANPIIGYTNGAGANHYWVEEVSTFSHTLTVGEAGWASLVLGYNATIPAGVKAYAVTAIGTGSATLTEITDAIPAGEAVLLEGAGTHEFKLAETATAVEGNKLEGTLFNTNIAKAAWILGIVDEEVGLYTVTLDQEEGTAFTNNAFKAYLPKTSTEGALRLEIGTTGIENAIIGENGNAAIFDLSGRRVSKMQKGIYIVNGKKVYVK